MVRKRYRCSFEGFLTLNSASCSSSSFSLGLIKLDIDKSDTCCTGTSSGSSYMDDVDDWNDCQDWKADCCDCGCEKEEDRDGETDDGFRVVSPVVTDPADSNDAACFELDAYNKYQR